MSKGEVLFMCQTLLPGNSSDLSYPDVHPDEIACLRNLVLEVSSQEIPRQVVWSIQRFATCEWEHRGTKNKWRTHCCQCEVRLFFLHKFPCSSLWERFGCSVGAICVCWVLKDFFYGDWVPVFFGVDITCWALTRQDKLFWRIFKSVPAPFFGLLTSIIAAKDEVRIWVKVQISKSLRILQLDIYSPLS